jgi:hypothetical protein
LPGQIPAIIVVDVSRPYNGPDASSVPPQSRIRWVSSGPGDGGAQPRIWPTEGWQVAFGFMDGWRVVVGWRFVPPSGKRIKQVATLASNSSPRKRGERPAVNCRAPGSTPGVGVDCLSTAMLAGLRTLIQRRRGPDR